MFGITLFFLVRSTYLILLFLFSFFFYASLLSYLYRTLPIPIFSCILRILAWTPREKEGSLISYGAYHKSMCKIRRLRIVDPPKSAQNIRERKESPRWLTQSVRKSISVACTFQRYSFGKRNRQRWETGTRSLEEYFYIHRTGKLVNYSDGPKRMVENLSNDFLVPSEICEWLKFRDKM